MSKRDRRVAARIRAASSPSGKHDQPESGDLTQSDAVAGQAEGRAAGEGNSDAHLRPVRRGGQAMVTRTAVPAPGGDPAGEQKHLQLTTLAGWRGFVAEMPTGQRYRRSVRPVAPRLHQFAVLSRDGEPPSTLHGACGPS
jgi:hypothetical protein